MASTNSPPAQPPGSSPGKERASKSPEQRLPSPTSGTLLPGNYWTEAPLADDDVDDPGAEDLASSTASLSSSVVAYRTIQGRTYHSNRGNAEYWGSNDDKQLESMDLGHHAHTLILGDKLFLAPLKDDIQKAVDIGTGTGLWAIDFADAYPNCEVTGTDISPIQPTWVPPNLKFEIDDCSLPWTFEPDSLDYIHIRYMAGSIQDWFALFKEAYQCTKPGGYIESFDTSGGFESDDGSVTENSAMAQWGKLFGEGGKILGRPFDILGPDLQRRGLKEAGFVELEEVNYKVPLGRWPKDPNLKEVGACTSTALARDTEGYILYVATLLGWTKEEMTVYAAHFRRELRNPKMHGYYRVKVIWGKKPKA